MIGTARDRLMRMVVASLGVAATLAVVACSTPKADPAPRGSRALGVKVNPGQGGDFATAFTESRAAGSETQTLPLDWNELETTPGVFEPKTNFLAIGNQFYSAHGTPIHLSIRPVHTNQKVVPRDLLEVPFSDPRMVQRFKALLDWVAAQVPKLEIVSLSIGSEVDVYMWGAPERWAEWTQFYAAVASHARRRFPETLITSETTHSALVGPDLGHLRRLHESSDAIGVSYYPMEPGLKRVRPPTVVREDFNAIVAAVPDKPMLLYQIGYPSSPALRSSPEQQAAFVRAAFSAWDTHSNRMRLLNFQWMHETTSKGLDHYADYYDYDTKHFRAFLGSLGLQTWSGEPKPAWQALKEEARARGFGQRQ